MVGIAQLVSAPDCGSGGRGFESLYPPQIVPEKETGSLSPYLYPLGYSQAVRQRTLTPSSRWFESSYPNHVAASCISLAAIFIGVSICSFHCASSEKGCAARLQTSSRCFGLLQAFFGSRGFNFCMKMLEVICLTLESGMRITCRIHNESAQ